MAQGFAYLNLTTADGAERSIAAAQVKITFADGVLVAVSSSKSGAEMGIDADGNSHITIKGGYVFTGGGSQGGSSSTIGTASQGYYWLTGKSFSETNYYTLADASNNNIFTIKLPCSVSSSYSLISAPQMVKGSTYTLKSSTTAPTDATSEFEGFYLGSSAKGTTAVASFTAQ